MIVAISIFGALAVLLLIHSVVSPLNAERIVGIAKPDGTPRPSDAAKALYSKLRVVDMHADSLMWKRDLSKKSPDGLVDFPRLIEGNVTLQFFMAVIDAPNDITSDEIDNVGDQIRKIAIVDAWPLRTWFNSLERAKLLAARLARYDAVAGSSFRTILTRSDLEAYLEDRERNPNQTAGLLGIEGSNGLNGSAEHIDTLFEAGYRSLSLSHYHDNPFAGSNSGRDKHGLTPLGLKATQRMAELGMLIDLSHVAEEAAFDILEAVKAPVYISHSGVYEICKRSRNTSDALIKAVAARGGIIGIGFFEDALGSRNIEDIIEAIMHVRNLVGAEYVSLGSGFDISPLPLQVTDLPVIVDRLLDRGLSEAEIADIMGENCIRFLLKALPQ